MMLRRLALTALLAGAALSASAADKSIYVVKLLNFSCSICRASEIQDETIRQAAKATGGQFVYAPMPSEVGTYAREKVYYASRMQGPTAEAKVRAALYRGAQDMELPLSDMSQVIEWLKDEIGPGIVDWAKLRQDASGPEAEAALSRAAGVAVRSGAQALPSYVLIEDNEPVATLDTTNMSKGSSLLALRDEVVSRINQIAKGKK